MAGPAPKFPEHRRRRNTPALGEWRTLGPLEKPVLPPARRDWSESVKRLWNAWRKDPVTATWTPSDVAWALETVDRWALLTPGEQRLRVNDLGLTATGRRNLRLQIAAESAPAGETPPRDRSRLRAV